MNIAVLASTSGTDLPALFSEAKDQKINTIFITNKKNCGAREKAKEYNIKDFFIDSKNLPREEYDRKIIEILEKNNIEVVCLVGYMRILSSLFIQKFPNKIFNVHPSLLPSFAGGMDTDVHAEVLKAGCKISGATLHIVTEDVDEGPIIMQKACIVEEGETEESLKIKVQKLEQEMLRELLRNLNAKE